MGFIVDPQATSSALAGYAWIVERFHMISALTHLWKASKDLHIDQQRQGIVSSAH